MFNTSSPFYQMPAWIVAIIIFSLIVLVNWLGFRYRQRLLQKGPEHMPESLGSMEGSLLGLMALMLGFSFGMGNSKFEERRKQVVEEANNIGVVILRSDMYPDSIRKQFRAELSEYVDSRIAYYDAGINEHKIEVELKNSEKISLRIWKRATDLSQDPTNLLRSQQMLPAINEMIDIVMTREAMRINIVPPLVLLMLLLLTLVSAFLSGFSHKAKRRNKVLTIAFALMTSLTLYLVMELDRPRRGLITIDAAEHKIIELKTLLNDTH